MANATATRKELAATQQRVTELIRICSVSRQPRKDFYSKLRLMYKTGSETSKVRYNKLKSHVHIVSSFIFSPGTVRFGIHLPPAERETWLQQAIIARDEFRQTWNDAKADTILKNGLIWSLVYGATVTKVQPNPYAHFHLGYINPGDFGVGREDVADLTEQDHVCHWYSLSMSQIERWLGHEPGNEDLIAKCEAAKRPGTKGPSKSRLVLAHVSGTYPTSTVTAGFPGEPNVETPMEAEVDEPTVEFVDLWERRMFRRKGEDPFEDWLVTTCLADGIIPLAQRRNPDLPHTVTSMREFMPAQLPFCLLSPRPEPEYLWGESELDNLGLLQEWLEDHLSDIKEIVKKQLRPPKFFSGVPDFEEAGRAMNTVDGSYGSPEPNAKMEKLMPELRPETLKVYQMILDMFADTSGVPTSFTDPATQAGGVRSTGHFSMAAGIGAGRLRDMALVVEEFLGDVATRAFHIMQRRSTDLYQLEDGKPFLLSQLPYSTSISVDAHSSAPIFAEQTQQKAMMLQKAGALAPEDMVELIDPPNRDEYKARAKQLAKSRAENQEKMMEIQAMKAQKTGRK